MRVRTLCSCVMLAAAAGLLYAPLGAYIADGVQKSLFVSVTDKAGNVVKDMAADDFHIREDGTDRQVVAVKHASQPIRVEVLVDTAQAASGKTDYLQEMRTAVANFGKKLLRQSPDAKVALMEFGQAAVPVVRLTTDPVAFDKGVNQLVIKPGTAPVLLEALVAANEQLALETDSTRRAIVSINIEPSNEQSTQEPKAVVATFKKSGAQLWAASVQSGDLKNSKRDIVLNDFTKATGGQRDMLLDMSALDAVLQRYADALTFQYEIVYDRPEGKKPPQQVQVGNSRPGGPFVLHASGFAPQ
ncbi:MAG TPA: VWA domain-containing protein [Vicinamibacterales bacterium]|jgi:hypothetical protein|nr:VWA domain-containing protein [Vicinamibacterales bacterium]